MTPVLSLALVVHAHRMALAERPWDVAVRGQLESLRDRVGHLPPAEPALRTRPDPPPAAVAPHHLLIASTLGSVLLAGGLVARRGLGGPRWVPAVGGLVVVTTAGVAITSPAVEVGLVVRAATPLRTGNGASYPARLTLPAGAEVRERHRRGGWVQVELPGGGVGWLPAAAVLGGG